MNWLLLVLAVLPGILISYAIVRADRYEREPLVGLVMSFAAGGLATLPAITVERWALQVLGYPPATAWDTALLSFGVLAPLEELSKWMVLALIVFPSRAFNEPMDGIVYAVLIAMGFASVENVLYADRLGLQVLLLRLFTAVPAHLVFGIVQGYYAGMRYAQKARAIPRLLQGLLIAVLLHGLYDFLVLQRWSKGLLILGIGALYPYLYFLSGLVRRYQDRSPFRPEG